MSNGHGGYRKPENPAPVSGPGQHSKRTDGQVMSSVPGQDYGQKSADMNAQRTAPMAGAQPLPPAADVSAPSQPQEVGHPQQYQGGAFNRPTDRPGEPITTGVDIGPGAGSEALSFAQPQVAQGTGAMTALLQRVSATDTTGVLGQLMLAAQNHGA